ncbi:unnamed protein product [Toxocara canis]|uniref:Transposase n=1 Tax=Toxocara canis TaxID=6265 RepID=A0A183U7H6_TOXCA|nr:unnamed protein product [Toxocara canis]
MMVRAKLVQPGGYVNVPRCYRDPYGLYRLCGPPLLDPLDGTSLAQPSCTAVRSSIWSRVPSQRCRASVSCAIRAPTHCRASDNLHELLMTSDNHPA